MSVRWLIWRTMRSCMIRNADPAWRTSDAPSGLKLETSRPLPKLSAAMASRRIGLTWLRMKIVATANKINEVPTIQRTKT